MIRLICISIIATLLYVPGCIQSGYAQSGKAGTPQPGAARPEIGRYCKVYRAGEGLKVLLLRVGPEARNESLVALDGFDHPWDGKIFKASVAKADGRQEFTIQHNGRPFVVLVFRERYGQSTLFVPKYGTEETERLLSYSEDLSAECKPDILLSQYLNQQKK
ncbi:hypothetical protein [Spirosoma montaniterrae]|uniref:Uncharacterized protein n=1 Tax=Spirosoma montaniterrae TaxID=1178516 RepID=A0A1P9WTK9_9BACT|nr:hypothetical protein [Spirosoma montaniterrae]AQG78726.1 hypothetical protein AWR27_04885 [Spirosoma montaniterrae]